MKILRISCFIFSIALILSLLGCIGSAPIEAPKTPMFSNFKAPLSTNYENIEFGSKVGKATATSVLSLWTTGDLSIRTAAKNGGITKIKYVEYEYNNTMFFLYQKMTVIVYGD